MQLEFRNVNSQSSYTYDAGAVEKGEKTVSVQGKADLEAGSITGSLKETNPNTVRALEAANIAVNDSTVEMVEAMMKEGMKIDKESLQNMYRLLLKNPGVSSEQLVKMNALEMDITPENIRQFQVYENLSHQLTDSFESISDSVLKVASDLFENGQTGQAIGVVKSGIVFADGSQMQQSILDGLESLDYTKKELLDMVDSMKSSIKDSMKESVQDSMKGSVTESMKGSVTESMKGSVIESMKGSVTESMKEAVQDSMKGSVTESMKESVQDSMKGTMIESMNETMKNSADNLSYAGKEEAVTKLLTKLSDALEMIKVSDTPYGNIKSGDFTNAQTGNVQVTETPGNNSAGESVVFSEDGQNESNVSLPNENLLRSQINSGAEKLQDMVENIITRMSQGSEMPELTELADKTEKFVKESLFGRQQFAKELKQTMTEGLLLRPEDVAESKSMHEYFDKLMNRMEQMTNTLRDAGLNQTPLQQNITSMRENVQFMNQLNQVFQYVQLPLKMSNKNTSGDLYVYSNKKNLTDNDGNISAFVHLDMDYIGPLDVYIRMSKGMNVATDFYIKDEETLEFIGEHIHLLNERLAAKGYVIDTNLSVKEEKKEKSVMEHMMDKKAMSVRTKLLSTNSFDTLA